MAIFLYKAKKGPDEIVNDKIDAPSQEKAIEELVQMGLTPISVVEKNAGPSYGGTPYRKVGRPPVGWPHQLAARSQDIDILTRQLASLIKAGVPVLRALSLIFEQTENKGLRQVAGNLEEQIRDGKMLSEAMSKFPHIFNNLYVSMVKAGEKGGVLDEALYRLAEHREREQEIRRKIQTAAAYPLFVIIVGIITVFVMLTFFLPKLTGIFESMQNLPLPTKILINISTFMNKNWYWFILVFTALVAVFLGNKQGSKKKLFFDVIKLHMPFVKDFVKNSEISKFARTLGLLFKNGISVHESLQLAADTLDNEALRSDLNQARSEILNKGSTLSASLKKINIFPAFAVNMIAVGEEGGKLEESLAEISNVYDREVEQSIKVMASLLEPILILAVGLVVGFIVFAMLLPIFSIGVAVK